MTSKQKSHIQTQIDKERALMHYYKSKPDLLSKCKMEVHKKQLEDLKRKSAIESYNAKVQRFLNQHPEYKEEFKNES